jgi:DNA-binding MarR family transcriptional regulator
MDRTTLTANLKPLQRRALVAIAVDPDDRRGRRLELTETGRALLGKAMPIWNRAHGEVDRLIGPDETDALRRGLRSLA